MAMQIFSLIAILGALVILIPTALRVFGKQDESRDDHHDDSDR
ncbi:hypothetical protein [Rhodococcus sp. NPDC058521]